MSAPATSSRTFGLGAIRSDASGPLAPVARLRRLASLERGDVIVIVVYAIAIGLVSLAVPIAAQSLVNTVAFTALIQPIAVLSILVLVGLFAAGVLRALQVRIVETLQQRFFVRATHDAARRLARSDVNAFNEHRAPEMMNRFFDVAIVQKTASTLLLDGLAVLLQGGVSLILLAFYHPLLLAFDVILVAMIAFVLIGLGRGGIATAVKESKAKYAAAAWLEEVAGAFHTFKPDPSARFALQRADLLARDYVEARQKHFKILFRQTLASYFVQAFATAALLGLGGSLIIKGQLTLGQLVAAEIIVNSLLAGVAKFGKYLESYYDLCASIDKVGLVVDLMEERSDGVQVPASSQPAHVKLEGVTFDDTKNVYALHDVSFELRPGTWTAIVGNDASGKKTLAEILYGLRAPSRGQILLDGVDARSMTLSDLRRDVALAGEPEIVDGTVLDNLSFGLDRVDGVLVSEALKMVSLSEEIAALPEGVLTQLRDAGSRLTSSQAVRLVLARCLVRQPRLLIIDDALDRLGTEAARMVLQGVSASKHPTTVVVFTSRDDIAELVGHAIRLEHGVRREFVARDSKGVAT